ncbi:hypothetical protein Q3G72_016851 [Acer saccharum]|nr:hypothetical protein Q3G72_016851 [Acer saccharum]
MGANLLRVLLQGEEDDEDDDYASLLAIASLEEEEHANKGQSSHRRGSIPGHAIIQRYRVEDDDHIDFNYDVADETPTVSVSHEHTPELHEFIQNHHRIRDRQTHSQLQSDLVEHLWQQHGGV